MKSKYLILALACLLQILVAHRLPISAFAPDLTPFLPFNATAKIPKQAVEFASDYDPADPSSSEPSTIHTLASWNPYNVASNADWARFSNKGNKFQCMMESTDAGSGTMWPDPMNRIPPSASSRWGGNLVAPLHTWYWHEGEEAQVNCDFRTHRIDDVLASLGINSMPREYGGDNLCYSIKHFDENSGNEVQDQLYTVGERLFQATGAYYRFGINSRSGAIFAQNLVNPYSAAVQEWRHTPSMNEMPPLRSASDIIFAYWLRAAMNNPWSLRYYFVNHVVNVETVQLVARVLQRMGMATVSRWPGVVVNVGTEDAAALIGSPIGAKLAYLLLQHKAELGIKTVTQIIIFRERGVSADLELQLLFRIENAAIQGQEEANMERRDGAVELGIQQQAAQAGARYVNGVRTHVLVW